MQLPLSVIIPTKNSMPYLQVHVEGLRPWIDLGEEIIVVDSYSTDGSLEFLQKHLPPEKTRILNHPPGLYASWNHGIRQVKSTYFYIATTGDTITATGIKALVTAADGLKVDVVISKPTFRGEDNRPRPTPWWPIDDIITSLGCTTPRRLSQAEAILFTATNPDGAMLGSSASNLYRTTTFQRLPFPTEFGLAGDGAWACLHAAEISWGVIPDQCSSFLLHSHAGSHPVNHTTQNNLRADSILRESMARWRQERIVHHSTRDQLRWSQLIGRLSDYLDAKAAFDVDRKGRLPWALNPVAWHHRLHRTSAKERLHRLKQEIFKSCQ